MLDRVRFSRYPHYVSSYEAPRGEFIQASITFNQSELLITVNDILTSLRQHYMVGCVKIMHEGAT